jgi:hypothetical protein
MSREDNIYYARLAEQGERYEDMIRYMKEVSRVSAHPAMAYPFQSFNIWFDADNFSVEWIRAFERGAQSSQRRLQELCWLQKDRLEDYLCHSAEGRIQGKSRSCFRRIWMLFGLMNFDFDL